MCTLKNEHVPPNGNTRGYMYPQTEIWVGMLPVICESLFGSLYVPWACKAWLFMDRSLIFAHKYSVVLL